LVPQRRERDIRGHQLGEGSGLDALVGIPAREALAAGRIEQQPGLGRERGRRWSVGERGARDEEREKNGEDAQHVARDYTGPSRSIPPSAAFLPGRIASTSTFALPAVA